MKSSKTMAVAAVVAAMALVGGAGGVRGADEDNKDAKVPVSRAVLFNSGVGYFEHRGQVQGNAELKLMFKTDQINDVLKSMVLMDEKGGNATAITYPSQEPIARALKSFGVDISGKPTLPELLDQLRGAKVVVTAPEEVTGSILSVEKQVKVVGQPLTQVTEYTLVLVTATGIRSVPMASVQSLTLSDEKLQGELNQALTLLVESRDKDRKPVVISFAGEGKRDVRVGYLVETPVWKTSYRLDLSGKKPLLQGWAIVENTSDVDWNGVTLTLVSGRPISFVQDLYTPLFVARPVVQPELYASLKPRNYEEGIATADKMAELSEAGANGMAGGRGGMAMRKSAAFAGAPMPAAAPMMMDAAIHEEKVSLASGVRAVASGSNLGELFEFTIQHPIQLARRRSAMLPILNSDISAEKVSIYNQQQLADHPLNGVLLKNDTGMKLMSGPVTVFDDGAYAGDAQIGNLAPDDKRPLSYAIDLAVTVDPSQKQDTEITAIKIIRGILEITHRYAFTQTYLIKNKAKDKRTLIVEQPFINGRELIKPKSFEEKTPQNYRFRVPIEANTTGTFVVEEQMPQTEQIGIFDMQSDQIAFWMRSNKIDGKVKDALAKAVAMKNELSTLEVQMNSLNQQMQQIKGGQDRLRQNITTAGRDSQLGQRYLKKLAEEEDQIEKLNGQISELRKQIEAKRNELANYLGNLSVAP